MPDVHHVWPPRRVGKTRMHSQQRYARPGTQDKNAGSYKNRAPTRTASGTRAPRFRPAPPPPRRGQPPLHQSPRRDELERDWYRQRKGLRSMHGASRSPPSRVVLRGPSRPVQGRHGPRGRTRPHGLPLNFPPFLCSWTGPHHMRRGHLSGDDDFDSVRPASGMCAL